MTASTGNQDVVDILTADHHEVLDLVGQIPTADATQRRDMADTVIAELMRHSVAEEMYVYPAMRDHLPDGEQGPARHRGAPAARGGHEGAGGRRHRRPAV